MLQYIEGTKIRPNVPPISKCSGNPGAGHGSLGNTTTKNINKSSTQYVVVLLSPQPPEAEWNSNVLSATLGLEKQK